MPKSADGGVARNASAGIPVGRRLGELPAIFASLPRLSEEEAASFAADIDAAREELAQIPVYDPWEL
jgi:hypothetical protein